MATELAQAYVQIIPSADGIAGNLENLIGKEIEGAGSHVGSIFSDGFSGALGDIVLSSAEIVTSVVDLFSSMTESISQNLGQMATYGDGIDKLSQKLGISAEALQEWDFVAQHSGTSIEALRGSFKILATQAQNGADEFEKLGISLDDVSTMSTEDLFGAVIEGLQGMEEGTERTAVASKLLGRGATELGALLNMSAEDTEEMKNRVHELGGVLSDEAVKDSAAYKDSLQDLMVSFNGLKNNLVSEFLPSIQGVMDGLTALITGDESGLGMISEGIKELSNKMLESLPLFMGTAFSIVSSIGTSIIENLPLLASTAFDLISTLGTMLIENLPLLIDTASQIIISLMDGIGSNSSSFFELIASLIPEAVDILLDNLPLILQSGISLLMELVNGIISATPQLLESLPQIINSMVECLTSLIPMIVECGVSLLTSLVNNLDLIISSIVSVMPQIINSTIDALINLTPLIVAAGFDLFVALIQNADEIITQVLTLVSDLITSTVNAIEENWDSIAEAGFNLIVQLVTKTPDILVELENAVIDICDAVLGFFEDSLEAITDIGWNLIEGFINGAKDAWNFLKDGFLSIIDGAVDAAKDLLGIASPSKVFKEIGEFVVEGFDEGTEGLGDSAVEQTQQMIKDINNLMEEDGINFDIESAMRYNGAYDGNVAFDSTNNYLYNLLSTYLPQIASGRNMNISLEGGAEEIFKVVRTSNREYTDSTGYNPMVMG